MVSPRRQPPLFRSRYRKRRGTSLSKERHPTLESTSFGTSINSTRSLGSTQAVESIPKTQQILVAWRCGNETPSKVYEQNKQKPRYRRQWSIAISIFAFLRWVPLKHKIIKTQGRRLIVGMPIFRTVLPCPSTSFILLGVPKWMLKRSTSNSLWADHIWWEIKGNWDAISNLASPCPPFSGPDGQTWALCPKTLNSCKDVQLLARYWQCSPTPYSLYKKAQEGLERIRKLMQVECLNQAW